MLWKKDSPLLPPAWRALCWLLAGLLLSGCAGKPWQEPLGDKEADSVARQVDELAARDKSCGGTIDGDVALFYRSPVEKKALSGFLQFSTPASYKFVISNPLGQPVLIITGDQSSFQLINTLEKKFLAGSIRSFGLRNDIPSYFLKSNWAFCFTGRNPFSSKSIVDVRSDREARGVWITFQNKQQTGWYHLLLDKEKGLYRTLILENGDGKTVAEIDYDDWLAEGQCLQPRNITISGLDYGTEIRIELSDVVLSKGEKNFQLNPPPGYLRQYMP